MSLLLEFEEALISELSSPSVAGGTIKSLEGEGAVPSHFYGLWDSLLRRYASVVKIKGKISSKLTAEACQIHLAGKTPSICADFMRIL
ncbi:hypothetical protein [Paenibacillus planticolens]|uniref:Uncharacterized protein n=1 Tax=Paenibacillus planticolens TaxID=2654976 RepID=A0ABX1ZTH9_9BACL|nr:hypothetical protein [Paenibacillus planticolens]NOV02968.1 hypothetical protein [Paenibacillus planticolens]